MATAVPDVPLRRFGGAGRVTTPKLARFMLMWGMAYSRTGTVAADEFTADWVADDRRSQKFVEPVIGAMWAVMGPASAIATSSRRCSTGWSGPTIHYG